MLLKPVRDVIHFYYCLSVAVKINKKYNPGVTVIHTNIFILKWLEEARKNKKYSRIVHSEIDWLAGHIRSHGPIYKYAEKLIDKIYNTSVILMHEKESQYIQG